MNTIKKVIIALIIIIIIIITAIAIIFFNKGENPISGDSMTVEESFNKVNKLAKIENKSEWLDVQNCLNQYSSYSDNLRLVNEAEKNGGNITEQNKEYYEKIKEQLIDITPIFVQEELKITKENSYEKIGIKDEVIRINNIYKSVQTYSTTAYEESSSIYAYLVEGVLINKNNYQKRDLRLILLIDYVNNTFSIIPNEYIELKNIDLSENANIQLYDEEEIEINNSNTFSPSTATNEEICQKYFVDFKSNLIYDIDFAYNCLDKEYREKRFGTFEGFQNFVKQNIKEINLSQFKQYLVDQHEDYTEYVCRDQYQNLYIFKETAPMEFTLTLDTYTLPNDVFTEEYNKSDENMKVMMNIDKWRQMLNNRDYNAAYNVLDETFKQNNFDSVEKFEEYMRNNLPLHYKIKFGDFSNQGQNYVQQITLSDITDDSQNLDETAVTKTIIMKIDENSEDFVMSFDI